MSVRQRVWTIEKKKMVNGVETLVKVERTAWQADYRDANGKRQRKNFAKKKDADAFVARAKTEVADGLHVPDSETVTIEEAGRLWLKSGAAAGLERTTLDQRRQHLELHLVPIAGATRLNKVTAPFVRSLQDKLRDAGRSPAMVKRVTVSLGSILADAQSRGLVVRNAVHELSRSRTGSKSPEKRHSARLRVGVDIPTNDEVSAFLRHAAGRYRPLLVTMTLTGMRASEARGLRWDDVDLKSGQVTISQRADRYSDIGSPKSAAGQRTIPLPPLVTNTLKEWKLACPKSKAGLVFPNSAGKVEYHNNMLHRGLWPAWIAAGVTVPSDKLDDEGQPLPAPKYSGFHALRHWYASWCINRKADGGLELSPKQVQARMGHSSIQVTYDTYGHLFPASDEGKELEAAQDMLLQVVDGT